MNPWFIHLAQLLGFPNHASFNLDIRMAKNPEAVKKFLEDLQGRLTG
jgi:metallopeptidase MepB